MSRRRPPPTQVGILFGPRLFPEYHKTYYATFWFDPHGFLLEIVCHKPEDAG